MLVLVLLLMTQAAEHGTGSDHLGPSPRTVARPVDLGARRGSGVRLESRRRQQSLA